MGDIDADISIGDVWGSSFSDIFVASTHGNDGGSQDDGYDDGYIWRYNGATWRLSASAPRGLNGVWGTSGNDVFAVGVAGLILHYNGSTWSQMPSGTTSHLSGVWGRSSTDVFAAGYEASAIVILHYDGSDWSEMGRYPGTSVRRIWGSSDRDVFVLDYYGVNLLHYDGTTWRPMRIEGNSRIWDIWGRSSDDLYALTDRATQHYDGSTWRLLEKLPAQGPLHRLLGTSAEIFGFAGGGVYRLGAQ
jgi:hypothetical protein